MIVVGTILLIAGLSFYAIAPGRSDCCGTTLQTIIDAAQPRAERRQLSFKSKLRFNVVWPTKD